MEPGGMEIRSACGSDPAVQGSASAACPSTRSPCSPLESTFEARTVVVPALMVAPEDRSRLQVALVLEVGDCRGAYEHLRAAGVEFLAEPFSPPWGGARCFAVDPDGYPVELEQLA